MKKYLVEAGFAENFLAVEEWDGYEEWNEIEAESAEDAAKKAVRTDGFENAMFRVYELTKNEFGELEKADSHNPEMFDFRN